MSGEARREAEQRLLDAGVLLPLPHRAAWAMTNPAVRRWLIATDRPVGVAAGGFAVEISPSRALPGHFLLRVPRLGHHQDADVTAEGLRALTAATRAGGRVLRVNVELFCRDPDTRQTLGRILSELGFRKLRIPRSYPVTLALDLAADEDTLLAGLHKSARQNLRGTRKAPVTVQPITDPSVAPRLAALEGEALARTGAVAVPRDWQAVIAMSAQYPGLSRIAGLVWDDIGNVNRVAAFAWGRMHGDHAEYHAAASTRDTDLRIALGYAPLLDLILWAKRAGASWFDLGGVAGHDGTGRLGGIDEFKRYFSRVEIDVGEEWILEPSPSRAHLASMIGGGARWVEHRVRRLAGVIGSPAEARSQ